MTVLKRASLDTLAAFGYGYGKPLRALLPIVLVLLTFLFFRKRVTGQAVLDQADFRDLRGDDLQRHTMPQPDAPAHHFTGVVPLR